jgi:hypothetical protein
MYEQELLPVGTQFIMQQLGHPDISRSHSEPPPSFRIPSLDGDVYGLDNWDTAIIPRDATDFLAPPGVYDLNFEQNQSLFNSSQPPNYDSSQYGYGLTPDDLINPSATFQYQPTLNTSYHPLGTNDPVYQDYTNVATPIPMTPSIDTLFDNPDTSSWQTSQFPANGMINAFTSSQRIPSNSGTAMRGRNDTPYDRIVVSLQHQLRSAISDKHDIAVKLAQIQNTFQTLAKSNAQLQTQNTKQQSEIENLEREKDKCRNQLFTNSFRTSRYFEQLQDSEVELRALREIIADLRRDCGRPDSDTGTSGGTPRTITRNQLSADDVKPIEISDAKDLVDQ